MSHLAPSLSLSLSLWADRLLGIWTPSDLIYIMRVFDSLNFRKPISGVTRGCFYWAQSAVKFAGIQISRDRSQTRRCRTWEVIASKTSTYVPGGLKRAVKGQRGNRWIGFSETRRKIRRSDDTWSTSAVARSEERREREREREREKARALKFEARTFNAPGISY